MSDLQDKFRSMFAAFDKGVTKPGGSKRALMAAQLTAIDEDGICYVLAEWKKGMHSSGPPENMPEEYEEGFERAVLDSPIVSNCMRLPLSTENQLKTAVFLLNARVVELEGSQIKQLSFKL